MVDNSLVVVDKRDDTLNNFAYYGIMFIILFILGVLFFRKSNFGVSCFSFFVAGTCLGIVMCFSKFKKFV